MGLNEQNFGSGGSTLIRLGCKRCARFGEPIGSSVQSDRAAADTEPGWEEPRGGVTSSAVRSKNNKNKNKSADLKKARRIDGVYFKLLKSRN